MHNRCPTALRLAPPRKGIVRGLRTLVTYTVDSVLSLVKKVLKRTKDGVDNAVNMSLTAVNATGATTLAMLKGRTGVSLQSYSKLRVFTCDVQREGASVPV